MLVLESSSASLLPTVQMRFVCCCVVVCFNKSAAPSSLLTRPPDAFLSVGALKEASAGAIIHFLLSVSSRTEKITCVNLLNKQIC